MKNGIKFLLVTASVAGGVYLVYRYMNKKPKTAPPAANPSTKATATKTVTPAPGFPIKKGSKGDKVLNLQKQLIAAYGASVLPKYGADGDWGSEMDAAMKAKVGVIVINSQSQYDSIVKSIKDSATKSAMKQRAQTIYEDFWKSGSTLQLMTLQSVRPRQVAVDNYNSYSYTGKALSFGANLKLNRKDYQPTNVGPNGELEFRCVTGANTGTYLIDANAMTLV